MAKVIKNTVFASLIIKTIRNEPVANVSNVLLTHTDSVNIRMDRGRSEREVNLSFVSIPMDGREVLRKNVKEVGDVESRPHTTTLGDSTVQIKVFRSHINNKYMLFSFVCNQTEMSRSNLKQIQRLQNPVARSSGELTSFSSVQKQFSMPFAILKSHLIKSPNSID